MGIMSRVIVDGQQRRSSEPIRTKKMESDCIEIEQASSQVSGAIRNERDSEPGIHLAEREVHPKQDSNQVSKHVPRFSSGRKTKC